MKPFNWIKLLAILLLLLGCFDYSQAARFWDSWFLMGGAALHLTVALGVLVSWRRAAVVYMGVDPAKT